MKNSKKLTCLTAIIAVIASSMISIACEDTYEADDIAVTGVSLKPSTYILVGHNEILKAVITPADATNKNVTWSSDHPEVATVTEGIVIGWKEGSAAITVTTADGGKKAACAVTVSASAVDVSGVSLAPASLFLLIGQTETLAAAIEPVNATNQNISWTSDKPSVAAVDNGIVTAIAAGTAYITVSTDDGGFTATCTVTVSALVPVTSVTLNKTSASISVGGSEILTATVSPPNATNKAVTWRSSNPGVALVENGTVTGVATGSATITVTTTEGGKTAECTVTVTSGGVNIPVVSVSLNKPSLSLAVNAMEKLTATILPDNASNKTVTWSSANASIATVSEDGTVTGKAVGSTTITAASVADNTKTAICSVTINIPVTSITLNKTITYITVGGTDELRAAVLPANATNKTVTWSSVHPEIATVDNNGVVTGLSASAPGAEGAPGVTTIIATNSDSGRNAACVVHVSASPVPVDSVSLSPATLRLEVGGTFTLAVTITPSNATNQRITWSSNNSAVSVVDGTVTAIAAGTAVITVTSEDGNKTGTCAVTVPEPPLSAANLAAYLAKLNTNTADVPHDIALKVSGTGDFTLIRAALRGAPSKFVKLDISESNITSIGSDSLRDCPTLAGVTMPDAVTTIGTYAFSNCTSLSKIEIKSAVKTIGNYAFSGCTSLASVIVPGGVTSIGSSVFRGCTGLETAEIQTGVTGIGNYMFFGCTKLVSVSMADSVTSIGVGSFSGCTSLESAPIPAAAASIGNNTFNGCVKLSGVEIPSTVKSIGESAFKGCTSLAIVTFKGAIPSNGFNTIDTFPGDLRAVFYGEDPDGTPGMYTRTPPELAWEKQ
jgi:uncharacterized protein YjdB